MYSLVTSLVFFTRPKPLLTPAHLATTVVRRVIFHDIPRKLRGAEGKPTLSEIETPASSTQKAHLRIRLTRVLQSKSAYAITFNPKSPSLVPSQIRAFTGRDHDATEFVTMSRKLAEQLFAEQHGAISPGLLCVVDVTSKGQAGLVLMKLEREEGARLELTEHSGKQTFAMSVLDNLVLTDGTRLFKTAMFVRIGKGEDDFLASACDTQINVISSDDLAKFWLRYLGCSFTVEPRVATQRFYEASINFINDFVSDAVHKNDLYEHLQSQLKSTKKNFSPKNFIEEYIHARYRKPFHEFLESSGIPLATFEKDLSDIDSRLRRQAYHTSRGATISVPVEAAEVVDVGEAKITVNDKLVYVGRK